MTWQYVAVYAIVDDENAEGLARVVETMSRTVAAHTLDGYQSGITVKPWDEDVDYEEVGDLEVE